MSRTVSMRSVARSRGAAWTPRPRRYSLLVGGSKQLRGTGTRRECAFPTSCRRTARAGTTPGPLRSAVGGGRESPRVSPRAHGGRRRPRSARALRRARRRDAAARRRARRGRAGRGGRRHRSTSTSPAGSPARTPVTASRRSSPRSTSRSTASSISASWSAPTSRTSRSAAGSPSTRPAPARAQKSILVNSGAEAIENAVKIARAATGRPAVVVFENGFHGRTLLTMAMTSKVRPYKAGFGPFPGEVYRAAAPYPYRGIDTDAAIASLEHLFKSEVEAETVACVVLETVQGEGGFIPMPADYLARLRRALRPPRDPLRRRRGAVGRREDGADVGDRAQRRRTRPARLGEVARRRAAAGGGHRPRRGHGRARARAGSAARSAAIRSPAPRRPSSSTRSPSRRSVPARTSSARRCARGWTSSPARHDAIGEVRGLGPMLALELREQSPDLAQRITAAAFERGLLLLSCGLYGNVLRLLPPLTVTDEELGARAPAPRGVACRRS